MRAPRVNIWQPSPPRDEREAAKAAKAAKAAMAEEEEAARAAEERARGGRKAAASGGAAPRAGLQPGQRCGIGIGAATTRAGDGVALSAASVENAKYSSGYIFGCTPETFQENMDRQLFGITKQHFVEMQCISPSSVLFLWDFKTKMLHGVFVPNGPPGLNLEPDAWKSHSRQDRVQPRHRDAGGSPYPAQAPPPPPPQPLALRGAPG